MSKNFGPLTRSEYMISSVVTSGRILSFLSTQGTRESESKTGVFLFVSGLKMFSVGSNVRSLFLIKKTQNFCYLVVKGSSVAFRKTFFRDSLDFRKTGGQ